MIGWIDQPSLVPFLPYLPDEIKEEFRTYVIKQMIKRTKCSDGRCFEEFKRINVCATKR